MLAAQGCLSGTLSASTKQKSKDDLTVDGSHDVGMGPQNRIPTSSRDVVSKNGKSGPVSDDHSHGHGHRRGEVIGISNWIAASSVITLTLASVSIPLSYP